MFLYRFVRRRHAGRRLSFMRWLFNNFFDFFHLWQDWWTSPTKYLIRFWSISVVTLTFNFQGQIWNLLYLSQKWSDCHETKSKHINWTLGLKWGHWVWPWPWPWPWIFKVKYGICSVSYTRVSETSAGCLRSIYPSLGMRQLFGDVTMGQWRHN